ncbi:hypothetical protein H632_c4p2 [Helicosporidium sp. ATCC 50920]|nr:hypothetical protein H632_c4p2 [Helicosporidium sp. ATCC 50920]|eukprot:KDD77172.1 hypothetical protein H632_c4p2 [Helicosporidium sp. ATCC 50920]
MSRNNLSVYIGNYEFDASERDLLRTLEEFGRVERVEFKSGYCFVHYENAKDADACLSALDGREWGTQKRRLRAELARGDTNVRQRESMRREAAAPSRTLFVAGYDPRHIRPRDLEQAFEPFGRVNRCEIRKSYAFVEFEHLKDAEEACRKLHGTSFEDRVLSVEYCLRDPGLRSNDRVQRMDEDRSFRGYRSSRPPDFYSGREPECRDDYPRGGPRHRSPSREARWRSRSRSDAAMFRSSHSRSRSPRRSSPVPERPYYSSRRPYSREHERSRSPLSSRESPSRNRRSGWRRSESPQRRG